VVEGVELRVVEFTGEPGDAILMHPWTMHASASNCAEMPRMVLTSTIYRNGIVPAALYQAAAQ
jgi:ectoine hydroxylase-related dioxygenase (phytanoyl-CoA dioxygenase family)